MNIIRTFKSPATLILLVAVSAFSSLAHAGSLSPSPAATATKGPRTTTEISFIDPATEQVVVTEKYKDGTVIRVVQIIHQDGSSETRGVREARVAKS